VDFKPNAVGMGMLTIPLTLPKTPMNARLEINQNFSLRINLKRAVTIAKIGIGQGQSWNHLTTMGTLNFGAKKGILQTKIHDYY
jgi:hypothetical protein